MDKPRTAAPPAFVTVSPLGVEPLQACEKWSWSLRAIVLAADPLPARFALTVTAPVVPPPVRPVPAVTPVMSPPLSLSMSSENPGGLLAIPDHGTADAKTAFGDGVSSWRRASVMKAPVLAPGRTPSSSQRLLPREDRAEVDRDGEEAVR